MHAHFLLADGARLPAARSLEEGAAKFTGLLRQSFVSGITMQEILVWLVVGAIAGSLAATIMTLRRGGFGGVANLVVGLLGALVGGVLFEVMRLDVGLGAIMIQYDDLAAALVGSMLLLLGVTWLRVRWRPKRRRA